jgi:tetratricopeptide (TPR) repeat protein
MARRRERRRRKAHPRLKAQPRAKARPAEPAPRAWPTAAALAVFAAAVLIHAPTLGYGFLPSWDDQQYVLENPWIRGWSFENVGRIFAEPYYGNYLPLHLVSYMVDYGLFRLEPFGYHLQSVLLGGVNAVLALLVTRKLFGDAKLAIVAALLFAVHPSHVEAVAWVSARKDLLATAFAMLSVIAYAPGAAARTRRAYLASVACFGLGMLSKASIAALPLFLLVVDALPSAGRRVDWRAAIANKIPYALIALVLVGINARAQQYSGEIRDPVQYLALKGHAAWSYLALVTGVPRGTPDYDTPELAGLVATGANLAGLVVLPAALGLALWRRWKRVGEAAGWMLALLAPAIFFPVLTYMADRYLYAASLGFCWLLAVGILQIAVEIGTARARAGVTAALAAVPFALFTFRTLEYQPVWADPEALWSYVLPRSRDYRARINLASVRVGEERWAEAEQLYLEASQVENFVAHHGLAIVYFRTQRYEDAQREIEQAAEIAARTGAEPGQVAQIEFARGEIYWALSQPEAAIEAWESALRANPSLAEAEDRIAMARGESPQAPIR